MACLSLVLYRNPEGAANGKSTVCYGQVAVGTLFYSLEGNTDPPDGEASGAGQSHFSKCMVKFGVKRR